MEVCGILFSLLEFYSRRFLTRMLIPQLTTAQPVA